jgi:K+-transporting ATPase ATPase C chain
MISHLRPMLVLFLLLTLLTGILYPLAVTVIAQFVFPVQANGSLIFDDGRAVGSRLIAQSFDDPRYFWERPSAAGYNASASSGSNLGPDNPALFDAVKARISALKAVDPSNSVPIPVDLVTASASGLDPHISVEAAYYQVPRVSRERGLDESTVKSLVAEYTESRQFGLLGEPRVNVLRLNLALDGIK